jgi:hypothetical protein
MAAAGRKFGVKDRPRALAVLVAVFLLGCLAGSAGSYFWFKKSLDSSRRLPDLREGATKEGPRPRPEPPRFKQILDLTPEQDAQFNQIVAESRKQMSEFRKQTDAFHSEQDNKIKAIISEMNRKINVILNEEQKKKFAAWQKEFDSRRRSPRRRDFPPPPQE